MLINPKIEIIFLSAEIIVYIFKNFFMINFVYVSIKRCKDITFLLKCSFFYMFYNINLKFPASE
jgi:hypothetical protein